VTLLVTAYDAHHNVIPTPVLRWDSDNPQVASVSSSGVVLALSPGTAGISARSDSLEALYSRRITVHQVALSIVPLPEFGDTIRLAPGQTLKLFAYEYDLGNDNASPPSHAIAWTSNHAGLATVDDSGVVHANSNGVAQVKASVDGVTATRLIEIIPAPAGTVNVRFVNAFDTAAHITLVPGAGPPVDLAYLDVAQRTVPAGTLQILAPGYPPTAPTYFDPQSVDVQQFTGFIPANSGATIIISPGWIPSYGEPLVLAPVWDWGAPIAADSVMVRVVLANSDGFNVYYTAPGAPISTVALQGCYLDWPYGVNSYTARGTGSFDIVLQAGKGFSGPESARFNVTPAPGRATTYVLAGRLGSAWSMLAVEDP
jgi:hypothetical protein